MSNIQWPSRQSGRSIHCRKMCGNNDIFSIFWHLHNFVGLGREEGGGGEGETGEFSGAQAKSRCFGWTVVSKRRRQGKRYSNGRFTVA